MESVVLYVLNILQLRLLDCDCSNCTILFIYLIFFFFFKNNTNQKHFLLQRGIYYLATKHHRQNKFILR